MAAGVAADRGKIDTPSAGVLISTYQVDESATIVTATMNIMKANAIPTNHGRER